jgi:hypothetical protein
VFKAERRSAVPPDTAGRPFLMDGSSLIPLENLTAHSVVRVRKVFASADALIKKAGMKGELLRDTEDILTGTYEGLLE